MLPRALVVVLCLGAGLSAASVAVAQTVGASGQPYPDRLVNGSDLGQSTRPQNLNPLGISYSDCVQDMTLRFSVTVSGFTGGQNLQVWATRSNDCTANASRGIGLNAAVCWLVNQGVTGLVSNTATTLNFDVRVQDLVGPQNAPPFPTGIHPQGPSACTQQPTFLAVPMDIWFLPLDSSGNVSGTAYDYSINTDLVGPPPPPQPSIADGDTLFVVNWTANSDSDTAGYDVFIDPIPGQEGSPSAPTSPVDATTFNCPDTGAPAVSEAGDDGPLADATATIDASMSDACVPVNHGGGTTNGGGTTTCSSSILTSAIVQDSGGAAPVQQYDEAGDLLEGGTVSGSGGISTIPAANLVGGGSAGVTVSDKSTGTYTISGLQDGVTYTVVVAAVDGTGNVGPPSAEQCDYPAPVNDFWHDYRAAGGNAGGSFCALEAVGMPVGPSMVVVGLGAAGLAFVRRRRRTRR